MNCPICKNEINENSKFCRKCGKKIPRCPQCGELVQAGMKFCLKDGAKIPDEVLALFAEKKVLRQEQKPNPPKKIAIDSRGSTARFCKKCGKPCEEGMSVCRSCSRKGGKDRGKGVLIAVIIIFLLLLLAIGGTAAWFIMNGELPFITKNPTTVEDASTITSNNDEAMSENEPDKEEKTDLEQKEESDSEETQAETSQEVIEYVEGEKEAFWGIWCVTSDDVDTVERVKRDLENDNYKAAIINPAEWDKLEESAQYVVTAGKYRNKKDAQNALAKIREKYESAYVDYTGEWIEIKPIYPTVTMDAIDHVSATSVLKEGSITHKPEYLFDNDTAKAWVEGVKGQGIGEAVTITLNKTYEVSGFTIHAGYQKTGELYEQNARPSAISLTFDDGSSMDFDLEDWYTEQKFYFDKPVNTKTIIITIKDTYKGTKYEDTVISEFSIF